jgi:ribonuclease BN (tRNA processing enzyme)
MLDCGNGAFGVLRERVDYLSIDAIVISHTHGDHSLDLLPMAYALQYSPRALRGEVTPPPLWLPPGARDRMRQIFDLIDRAALLDDAYDVHEYASDQTLQIGPFDVDFAPVPHFVPAHAIGVRERSTGRRLVFGADHRPCQSIIEFASGAELLMLEATLSLPEAGVRGHLTSVEAAEIARDAGVGRLLLTHMSDELPREQLTAAAAAVMPGTVLVKAGDVFTI